MSFDDFEEFEVDEEYIKELDEKYRYWYWIDVECESDDSQEWEFEFDE